MLGIISSGAFLWDARPFLDYALQYLPCLQCLFAVGGRWKQSFENINPSFLKFNEPIIFLLHSALQAKTHPLAELGVMKTRRNGIQGVNPC